MWWLLSQVIGELAPFINHEQQLIDFFLILFLTCCKWNLKILLRWNYFLQFNPRFNQKCLRRFWFPSFKAWETLAWLTKIKHFINQKCFFKKNSLKTFPVRFSIINQGEILLQLNDDMDPGSSELNWKNYDKFCYTYSRTMFENSLKNYFCSFMMIVTMNRRKCCNSLNA